MQTIAAPHFPALLEGISVIKQFFFFIQTRFCLQPVLEKRRNASCELKLIEAADGDILLRAQG